MAVGDPANILLTLFLVILVPVIIIYWIVRLAVKHELNGEELVVCGIIW